MRATMMDTPLTITALMRYGTTAYGDHEVITATSKGAGEVGGGMRRRTYSEIGSRVARLAGALRGLGVTGDQRVATLMWNNAEHLEAYLAIPSMGAVLHTLNLRLDPAVIGYIAEHAGDEVVIVDSTLVPLLARIRNKVRPARTRARPRRPSGALLRGASGRAAGRLRLARAG